MFDFFVASFLAFLLQCLLTKPYNTRDTRRLAIESYSSYPRTVMSTDRREGGMALGDELLDGLAVNHRVIKSNHFIRS